MHHFIAIKDYFFAYVASDGEDDEAGIKNNKNIFYEEGKIKNYKVLIDWINFYNQPINNIIKQYDEGRKVWWWLYNWLFIG